jgi:hypothetical protein
MLCHCCLKVECKDTIWRLKYDLTGDSEVSHPVVGEVNKVAVDGMGGAVGKERTERMRIIRAEKNANNSLNEVK